MEAPAKDLLLPFRPLLLRYILAGTNYLLYFPIHHHRIEGGYPGPLPAGQGNCFFVGYGGSPFCYRPVVGGDPPAYFLPGQFHGGFANDGGRGKTRQVLVGHIGPPVAELAVLVVNDKDGIVDAVEELVHFQELFLFGRYIDQDGGKIQIGNRGGDNFKPALPRPQIHFRDQLFPRQDGLAVGSHPVEVFIPDPGDNLRRPPADDVLGPDPHYLFKNGINFQVNIILRLPRFIEHQAAQGIADGELLQDVPVYPPFHSVQPPFSAPARAEAVAPGSSMTKPSNKLTSLPENINSSTWRRN